LQAGCETSHSPKGVIYDALFYVSPASALALVAWAAAAWQTCVLEGRLRSFLYLPLR